MALKDVIQRRLELVIEELKFDPDIDIGPNSELGEPPIGWDDDFIKGEFRGHVNGNALGFGDLLTKPIAKGEMEESTELRAVVDAILSKASVDSLDAYQAKSAERVRKALQQHIAALAGLPSDDVFLTEAVKHYIPSQQGLEKLRLRLTKELLKYLFAPIRVGDFNASVALARDRIVSRMLA